MSFFYKIFLFFASLFNKKNRPLKTIYVDDIPEIVKKGDIYVVGKNGYYWTVIFYCPCKCEKVIQLNLISSPHPSWDIEIHNDSTISLSPSVWGINGCKSHFFLKHGQIKWCKE